MDVAQVPRPEWSPIPHPDARGVESKALVREDDLFIAMLRFGENATIHEHPGANDTIVVCIEGEGFTSVGDEISPLQTNERVRWPRDVPHRLWTEASTMTTLMIERP